MWWVVQEKLNELARRLGAKFVSAEARGLCGSIFCDLGDEFTVLDKDGREPATGVIAKIAQDKVRQHSQAGREGGRAGGE